MSEDVIEAGREAWTAIKTGGGKTFEAWTRIGDCLLLFRGQAMQEAKCNSPYGKAYAAAINRLLPKAGLQDLDSQTRRDAVVLAENKEAITAWRETLSPTEQLRCNFPRTALKCWRAQTGPRRPGPKRKTTGNVVKTSLPSRPGGRPIYWSQDHLRKAGLAMREHWTTDVFKLARIALEAALPDEMAVYALLEPAPAAAPRASAEVGEHAHA